MEVPLLPRSVAGLSIEDDR